MKLLIMLIMVLFASTAYGADCKKHPIYCAINKLNPHLDKKQALKISNIISSESKKLGIDPYRSVAILMQESSFKNINTFKVDKHEEIQCTINNCTKTITEIHSVLDMGISQINVKTAIHYKFDVEKLFALDEEYALKCHFEVLRHKMKVCSHLGSDSWSCYHSMTEDLRTKYVQLVNHHYQKISPPTLTADNDKLK